MEALLERTEATSMPLTEALALGSAVWDGLLERAPAPSPFMSWAWHRAWSEAASPDEVAVSEALVVRDGDGAVRALLPVLGRRLSYRRVPTTALTWAIGDLGCPDHLDVLAATAADARALAPALEGLPWRLTILSNLAADAPAARQLCSAIADRGCVVRRYPLWGCPYLELGADWGAYLATLTPTRRQTLRRKERNLVRRHAMTITDYGAGRVEEGLGHLVRLHERRWEAGGESGAFRDPGVRRLHWGFAAELAACGRLWLSTLDLNGVPAAAWYGFTWGDTVYFYQSGRDPRWDRESVGLVLMGAMIRRAIERGYRRFDFLRGDDAYKGDWTAARRTTEQVTIFRPGWRGRVFRALDAAAQLRGRLRA